MEHESSCCENSFSLATSLHFPHHILPHCPRNAFDELQNFSQINCLFSFQCKSITLHEEDSPSLILRVRCGPHYLQPKISSYSVLIQTHMMVTTPRTDSIFIMWNDVKCNYICLQDRRPHRISLFGDVRAVSNSSLNLHQLDICPQRLRLFIFPTLECLFYSVFGTHTHINFVFPILSIKSPAH